MALEFYPFIASRWLVTLQVIAALHGFWMPVKFNRNLYRLTQDLSSKKVSGTFPWAPAVPRGVFQPELPNRF